MKCSVLLKQWCTLPRVSSIQFILANVLVIFTQSLLNAVELGDEAYQIMKNEEFIIEGLDRKFTSNFGQTRFYCVFVINQDRCTASPTSSHTASPMLTKFRPHVPPLCSPFKLTWHPPPSLGTLQIPPLKAPAGCLPSSLPPWKYVEHLFYLHPVMNLNNLVYLFTSLSPQDDNWVHAGTSREGHI